MMDFFLKKKIGTSILVDVPEGAFNPPTWAPLNMLKSMAKKSGPTPSINAFMPCMAPCAVPCCCGDATSDTIAFTDGITVKATPNKSAAL